jgi:UTP--glucose-1-phosphate uridylyltransferase
MDFTKPPSKPLRKAIFPVAGFGTRFLPATKSVPKEMLTVVDRPVIHYAVQEAIDAGCDTLIFITGRSKRAIEDYFDRSPELEAELQAKGKTEALDIVRNIIPPHVRCFYVRQPQALGLGHAVMCAADMIAEDEPFAVLLPDDLIDAEPVGVLKQMQAIHERGRQSVIAVEQVAQQDVSKYGILKTDGSLGASLPIQGIVEKPRPEEAPSNWGVIGRYILPARIMALLKDQVPGAGGEIQLTDAIARCLAHDDFVGLPITGKRFDCGNMHGFLEANVHFGMQRVAAGYFR